MPTVESPRKLERKRSFSLLFYSSLFSLHFSPLSTGLAQPLNWDVPSLPCVTSQLALFGFPLSAYPKLWIFTLSSCDTWPPLRLFDFSSPLDTWLNVSHPNKCQVSLVILGASKNVKFRLSWNSMKFDGVARFHETIPTVKPVSSSEI